MVVDGLSELNFVTFSDINGSTYNVKGEGIGLDGTGIISGGVWVSSLSADTMGLNSDVLEGVRWKTTFATVIVEVLSAVNKLLLR